MVGLHCFVYFVGRASPVEVTLVNVQVSLLSGSCLTLIFSCRVRLNDNSRLVRRYLGCTSKCVISLVANVIVARPRLVYRFQHRLSYSLSFFKSQLVCLLHKARFFIKSHECLVLYRLDFPISTGKKEAVIRAQENAKDLYQTTRKCFT